MTDLVQIKCKECRGKGLLAISVNCEASIQRCKKCGGRGSETIDKKTHNCIIITEEDYVTKPEWY